MKSRRLALMEEMRAACDGCQTRALLRLETEPS